MLLSSGVPVQRLAHFFPLSSRVYFRSVSDWLKNKFAFKRFSDMAVHHPQEYFNEIRRKYAVTKD